MQHSTHQPPHPNYPGEDYFADDNSLFPDYSFEDPVVTPMYSKTVPRNQVPNRPNFSSRPLPQLPPQTYQPPPPPQQTQTTAPFCKCGQPAVEKMSGPTAKNPNEPFWTCHLGKDQGGCGFFSFFNTALNKSFPSKNKRPYSQGPGQGQVPYQPQPKQQATPDNSIIESNLMLAQTLQLTSIKHEQTLISLVKRMNAMENELALLKNHQNHQQQQQPEESQKS